MITELSENAVQERDDLVARIHVSFAGVVRGKEAVSWNECVARDMYESEAVCQAARLSDRDLHWSELIDDENWHPFPGIGGFSFINPQGFQYYLPPTMIRFLRGDNSEWYPGHLLSCIERNTDGPQVASWSKEQLSCVVHLIEFMALHDDETRYGVEMGYGNPWADALAQRWA